MPSVRKNKHISFHTNTIKIWYAIIDIVSTFTHPPLVQLQANVYDAGLELNQLHFWRSDPPSGIRCTFHIPDHDRFWSWAEESVFLRNGTTNPEDPTSGDA